MRLVLTVAVTSTENRKKKTIAWVVILEAQSQAYCGRMNKMVKFFDMIPFLGVGLDLIPRADLQRYRFNCFSSPNNTASHAVMRCYIREKARLGEGVIHFHQPAYRLTGGKRVEPFAPYFYPAKLHISPGRALFLSSTATRPS